MVLCPMVPGMFWCFFCAQWHSIISIHPHVQWLPKRLAEGSGLTFLDGPFSLRHCEWFWGVGFTSYIHLRHGMHPNKFHPIALLFKRKRLASGANVKKRNKYGGSALKLALDSGQAPFLKGFETDHLWRCGEESEGSRKGFHSPSWGILWTLVPRFTVW